MNIFEAVGGEPTFRKLVDAFYDRVETDERIRHLFPPNLKPGKEHQYLFLVQYFGGPSDYNTQRGHPRLRMRHLPFAIGQRERDAWVENMLAAIDEAGIQEPMRGYMRKYFDDAGTFLMNQLPPGVAP
jgi:hemoglobin